MEQWQDAASQQVKLLTDRVTELLSKGLGLLRSELGVDLGLQPELIPSWVILLAACSGLVLMVALWASVCRALFKKRPAVRPADDGVEVKRGANKAFRSEEPKKKKKKADKKAQANGRAVAEPQEAAPVSEERVPHHQSPPPLQVKAEKAAEVKKSKKKAKQAAKETKTVTTDGKEPEEGTWETKVSNKEKREQRKKDKNSSDGSASPGREETPVSVASEPHKASAAPAPAAQKRKKAEATKVKAEKVEAAVSQVNSSEVAAVHAGVSNMAVKVPAVSGPSKTGPWTASREAASLWRAEIEDSWTVNDRRVTTTEMKLSFTGLGGNTAEPQSVSDLSWPKQPRVDDEWSGLNGASVDPSSDWNAPSEAWGNYEEPTPEPPPTQEQPLPEPAKVNLLSRATDDDEVEKDKAEAAADGAAKTKKKKKKKKKAAEEGGATGQGEEPKKEVAPSAKKQPPVQENTAAIQPVKTAAAEARVERSVRDITPQKPPVTQVPQKPTDGEPTAKQNTLPAPTQQKKPDESQAPKPAKKKKARRET